MIKVVISKRLIFTLSVSLFGLVGSSAQGLEELELTMAYEMAEANYPLIQNQALNTELYKSNLAIIDANRRPVVSLNGNAQYQSENVSIGAEDPESPISVDAPNETFRVYAEANFNLYDGGLTKSEREIEEAALAVNQQNLKVQLRQLKTRVNQLFFSIKLSRQQYELVNTSIRDIEASIEVRKAGYESGTVLESEVTKLEARKLELLSEAVKLKADADAYLGVLSYLLGATLSSTVNFILPVFSETIDIMEVNRPELSLYDFQKNLLTAQEGSIAASRKPMISLYAQNGVGYPNPLNFSDINTSWYALAGINVQWRIFDWGKARKQYEQLELEGLKTQNQRDAFEFDIQSKDAEFKTKIMALKTQIENDQRIVTLQSEITKQIEFQLQEGVINTNDYLVQVNAELAAKQELELHTVQLQQLQIEYLTHFGKL